MNVQHHDTASLQDRLSFLCLDSASGAALAAARPLIGAALPAAVDRFYDHMAKWPALTRMFADPSRRKHARDSQIKHWERLFEGDFGVEYMESVRRIGATHSRIGLEPRWFLGAYGQITADLQAACVEAYAPRVSKDPKAKAELTTLLKALIQATNLDMDLVIGVYLEENQARHARQLQELSGTFRSSVSASLDRASEDLGSSARQILASAEDTVQKGLQVDAAARGAHLSVQSIAAALEEVSRSVVEIRGQTDRSTKVAEEAVAKTKGIDRVMQSLTEAVARIDDSVTSINDIAERTNILAINASIEAARAGTVGRGFAVVATEVRNLASQTVGATEAISSQIQALKESARTSLGAVEGIVEVIRSIDKTTASIASAVEEQGVVTQEIAREAQVAADQSIAVTDTISQVSQAARETGQVAGRLEVVLGQMKTDFTALNQQVDAFLGKIL